MLDMMRRQSESFLIYLIFGAIIVVFAINFGPGSGSCRPDTGNFAAIVDGEVIPQREFYSDYRSQVENYRRRAQAANFEMSNEMLERMGLRKQVLDALVTKRLLAQEAARRGLVVSDDELVKHLETRYGVKDVTFEQYSNWVERSFETTVTKFEADVRNDILGSKMERFIRDNLSVSDDELKNDYLREHDRVNAAFVKFDPQETGVVPSQAAIEALLKDEMPAVEAAYNEDALKYRTPQRVTLRQIVRKLPEAASDADVAKVRGKLLELRGQLTEGGDFAALAKSESEDPATAAKGGEYGTFERTQLPKELADAVFALKQDEITAAPVRVGNTLVLAQVTAVEAPTRKKLDEVKTQVATQLLKSRAADAAAKTQADLVFAALSKGEAFEKLTWSEAQAKEPPKPAKGKTVVTLPTRLETGWMTKMQPAIPRIGVSKELADELFTLTPEKRNVSKVYKIGKSYYVVALQEREIPDLAKFDGEKETLKNKMLWTKRTQVYREWLDHLKTTANIQYNAALLGTESSKG